MIIWTMKSNLRDSKEAKMIRPVDLSNLREKKGDRCGSYMQGKHGIANGKRARFRRERHWAPIWIPWVWGVGGFNAPTTSLCFPCWQQRSLSQFPRLPYKAGTYTASSDCSDLPTISPQLTCNCHWIAIQYLPSLYILPCFSSYGIMAPGISSSKDDHGYSFTFC